VLAYAARRIPSALVVLFLASIAIFAVLRLTPGSPAVVLAGPEADPATIASITHELGLDRPLPEQYALWLRGVVTGQMGQSYILGAPIATLIGRGLSNTAELTIAAMVLAIVIALAAGITGATTGSRAVKSLVVTFTTISFAVPTFISGVVLVLVFAVGLRVLPPGGHASLGSDPLGALRFLILPAVCLALPAAAVLARFLQTSLQQVLNEDFIRVARAKGLPWPQILVRHALPNAFPGVVTVLGIQFGQLLGGAVIVEAIFAWPGLGQLILQSFVSRDYLLVQDLVLLAVTVFIVLQTLTDLAHAALDPRLRLER
jgi:peptide/nickel transport system permease protein